MYNKTNNNKHSNQEGQRDIQQKVQYYQQVQQNTTIKASQNTDQYLKSLKLPIAAPSNDGCVVMPIATSYHFLLLLS